MSNLTFKKAIHLLSVLIIVANSLILGLQPAPVRAEAPPPPVQSTLTPQPTAPTDVLSVQAASPAPTPANLSPSTEESRAHQAIEAVLNKYAEYYDARSPLEISQFKIEGEWGYAAAGELYLLAHRLPEGTWQALLPEDEGLFRQWLEATPENLIPAEVKGQFLMPVSTASSWPQARVEVTDLKSVAIITPTGVATLSWPILVMVSATGPVPLGPEQARQAALDRMKLQIEQGHAPAWAGATVLNSVTLYDLSGEVTAYLFPVQNNGHAVGYLTVAALQLPNPVLEFATTGPSPLDQTSELTAQQGLSLVSVQRPLYLGLLAYGYELSGLSSQSSRQVVDARSGAVFSVDLDQVQVPLRQQIRIDETIQSQEQPIQTLAYSLISGIPDWNQFVGNYGCYSGCSPTAATNVMGYWDNHGYGNLINGSDWQGAINEMRSRMGTECVGNGGSTSVAAISPGINSYAQAHGYAFASEMWCSPGYGCTTSPTYDRFRGEIDNSRPLVVDVIGHTTYQDHSVTGVGYETNGSYMIVHDNWPSTQENIYLQYGSGYSSIFMHPVTPGGGTSCPQSGGVILYAHANYDCGGQGANTGYVQQASPGNYDLNGLGLNEQASSIHIPSGWSARLYRESGFNGASVCLNGDDGDFSNNSYDGGGSLNDSVSSFRVYDSSNCSTPANDGVNLCRNTGYSNCMLFTNDAPSLGNAGFGNDEAESIQMLGDWSAVLFGDDNYGGTRSLFDGSDSNLSDNTIGNNQASSIRVRKRTPANFTLYDLGDWNGAFFPSDRTITDLSHWDFNDRAESIRVASGYEVIICEHSDFHGVCGRTTQNVSDLNAVAQGLRNGASSVRVCQGSCPAAPNAPSLTNPANGASFSPGSLVTFQWTGNGDKYYVELWGGGLGSIETSGWIDGTQWSRSGLPTSPNPYYWQVRAWNGYGESGWSGTRSFTIAGTPAAPSNLVATAVSREQVNLSWNDNSGNETGFKIYRNGIYIDQVGAGVTSYQDTDRQCNTTYAYTVRATNSAGDSSDSNSASAATYACLTQVDLIPTQFSNWAYPIIPASIIDTFEVNDLYTNRPTYLDWGVTNSGGTDSSGDVVGEVYVDSTLLGSYNFGQVLTGQAWYFSDWPSWTQSASGWHTLQVVVDPDNLIAESDENNNIWQGQFYWQPTCNDPYEDNDNYTSATSLAFGQIRSADICGPGDYDYYRFSGTVGQRIVVDIDAILNGSLLDSYVSLIDSDGQTVLQEHDDEPGSRDSHLGYELPHNGVYYIRVRAWNHPDVGGPDYFYNIRLLQDNTSPTGEITSPLPDAWLNPTQATVSVNASDGQSGVSHVEFLWHDANWSNPDWEWLGADWDGNDGWSWNFDTNGLPEQEGGAFVIWVFDWAGNWSGASVWNLGIDRTPPRVSASVNPMYGDAPFVDFWVDWGGSDNLSGLANYDIQYRDGPGGVWTNLLINTSDTYYRFVGQNGHTYYFRARARDWAGNQSVYAEGNGDAQYTVQICTASADATEPDNNFVNAKIISTNGTEQVHNFHAAGDVDWLKFTATAGVTYTLRTNNTGGHADTMISLYGPNGTTWLTANDDDPNNWPASRLEWGAVNNGVYYIKVEHWDAYAYGCTTVYEISVSETGHFETNKQAFLPLILK